MPDTLSSLSTRYEAVISLSVMADDRAQAVEVMSEMLREFAKDVTPASFGVEGSDDYEDVDVVALVPVDENCHEEPAALSFWLGTDEGENLRDSLKGFYKGMLVADSLEDDDATEAES